MQRKASSGLFIFILFFFLLPWLSVSCGTFEVQYDGVELLTGISGQEIEDVGETEDALEVSAYAWLVFFLAAAGTLVFFLKSDSTARKVRFSLALLGTITLLLLKFRTENIVMGVFSADIENTEFTQALVQVNWEIGYWLALFGFLVIIAVQFIPFEKSRERLLQEHPELKD
jgi:hypothetical protein